MVRGVDRSSSSTDEIQAKKDTVSEQIEKQKIESPIGEFSHLRGEGKLTQEDEEWLKSQTAQKNLKEAKEQLNQEIRLRHSLDFFRTSGTSRATRSAQEDEGISFSVDYNRKSFHELITGYLLADEYPDQDKKEILNNICSRLDKGERGIFGKKNIGDIIIFNLIAAASKLGTESNIKSILDSEIIKEHHRPTLFQEIVKSNNIPKMQVLLNHYDPQILLAKCEGNGTPRTLAGELGFVEMERFLKWNEPVTPVTKQKSSSTLSTHGPEKFGGTTFAKWVDDHDKKKKPPGSDQI